MANAVKLVISYATLDGSTTTHTYNYAKPDLGTSFVKALVNQTINAKAIFAKEPAMAKTAKLVTTQESIFDIDE